MTKALLIVIAILVVALVILFLLFRGSGKKIQNLNSSLRAKEKECENLKLMYNKLKNLGDQTDEIKQNISNLDNDNIKHSVNSILPNKPTRNKN